MGIESEQLQELYTWLVNKQVQDTWTDIDRDTLLTRLEYLLNNTVLMQIDPTGLPDIEVKRWE